MVWSEHEHQFIGEHRSHFQAAILFWSNAQGQIDFVRPNQFHHFGRVPGFDLEINFRLGLFQFTDYLRQDVLASGRGRADSEAFLSPLAQMLNRFRRGLDRSQDRFNLREKLFTGLIQHQPVLCSFE